MKYSYDNKAGLNLRMNDDIFGYAFLLIQRCSILPITAIHIAIGYYYGELDADLFSLDYNIQEKILRDFHKWANNLMSRI